MKTPSILPIIRSQVTRTLLQPAFLLFALTFALSAARCAAEDLPSAPSAAYVSPQSTVQPTRPAPTFRENRVLDLKFASLAVVSSGSAFADSYTTLFARENWLAKKSNVCNVEVESAYLYGTHPTVARTYAVATVKSAGSVLAAYYLRKHHSRLWALPLLANTASSLQGTTQNMIRCN